MSFKKPSETTVTNTIATAGGAFAGGMVSKGVFGVIHNPDTTVTDAATIKKNNNAGMLKRAGLAAAGVAVAMFADGNDATMSAARGVGYGMAIVQGLEIIAGLAKDSSIAANATTGTAAQKFAAKSLGLGCPCTGDTQALNGRGLRYADVPVYNISNMDNFAAAPSGSLLDNPVAIAARNAGMVA